MLAEAEAEFAEAFAAMGEQESGEFVPLIEKDKATGRCVAAYNARKEARLATTYAVEAAREAAVEQADADEAEAVAVALVLLADLEAKLDAAGLAAYVRAAAKDNNPNRRESPMPTTFRRPGGDLAAQLRSALERVGQADYYVLNGPELAKYKSGEPALDVFGNEVPVGLSANRVRRSHLPPARVLHPVQVEGGV